jgi:hypothetical protein
VEAGAEDDSDDPVSQVVAKVHTPIKNPNVLCLGVMQDDERYSPSPESQAAAAQDDGAADEAETIAVVSTMAIDDRVNQNPATSG